MKKQFIIFTIIFFISNNIFSSDLEEWQSYRLLHPTLEELQSEVVWGTITTYSYISDELIELAMDNYFDRIEYMYFCHDIEC